MVAFENVLNANSAIFCHTLMICCTPFISRHFNITSCSGSKPVECSSQVKCREISKKETNISKALVAKPTAAIQLSNTGLLKRQSLACCQLIGVWWMSPYHSTIIDFDHPQTTTFTYHWNIKIFLRLYSGVGLPPSVIGRNCHSESVSVNIPLPPRWDVCVLLVVFVNLVIYENE